MNSTDTTTFTNADGSIHTIIKFHHSHWYSAPQLLAPVALIFIIFGVILLFRKDKPGSVKKNL